MIQSTDEILRHAATLSGKISSARRSACERSMLMFARTYLDKYFTLKPCRMHRQIAAELETASRRRGRKLVIAAPRGHAKTTLISFAYVLWSLCYKREPYIMLISATADHASDLLSHVKDELTNNQLLKTDFPEVAPPVGSGSPRWRKSEIITASDAKVTALGAQGQIRGRKHKEHRPSLIIIDDLEDDESVRSPERRAKLAEWFDKTVMNCGGPDTDIVVAGTVLHIDSLLARLLDPMRSPGWTGKRYSAVSRWSQRQDLWERWESIYVRSTEYEGRTGPPAAHQFFLGARRAMMLGVRTQWPQQESYYRLMQQRLAIGPNAFASEKQNEPFSPAECVFQEEQLHFWDDEYPSVNELLVALGSDAEIFVGCDPATGSDATRGDYSALVSVVRDRKTELMYVIDAKIARMDPHDLINEIVIRNKEWRYDTVIAENNGFQELFATELDRRLVGMTHRPRFKRLTNTGNKQARIQSLQAMVVSGRILFSRCHRQLLEQLVQFPHARHDDGPDALEMAVRVASKESGPAQWIWI